MLLLADGPEIGVLSSSSSDSSSSDDSSESSDSENEGESKPPQSKIDPHHIIRLFRDFKIIWKTTDIHVTLTFRNYKSNLYAFVRMILTLDNL